MSEEEELPTDRRSPVGEPVIRGDESITGERAREAVRFDPDDPESVAEAAETVASFADRTSADNIYMLRGAAACAALVRAEGSYKAASARADGVPVTFIRKWARVHDLPRAIRIHVARGDIAPTAAKHIARVGGEARYLLAWAAIDNGLTVRDVRSIASAVNDGADVVDALESHGIRPGKLSVELPVATYRELRRRAAEENVAHHDLVDAALREYFRLGARQEERG